MSKVKPIAIQLLRNGLSPRPIAVTICLGIVLGIFPIFAPVSLVCLALAWAFGLNAPILLASYYAMTWVQPILILPYLRMGEFLFRAEPLPISLVELTRRFTNDALGTLAEFGWSFVHAVTGWLFSVPLLVAVLYPLVWSVAHRWQRALRVEAS